MQELMAKIEARVKELEGFITQSANNHHGIVGRFEEAKVILGYMQEFVNASEKVVEAISPEQGVSENAVAEGS